MFSDESDTPNPNTERPGPEYTTLYMLLVIGFMLQTPADRVRFVIELMTEVNPEGLTESDRAAVSQFLSDVERNDPATASAVTHVLTASLN